MSVRDNRRNPSVDESAQGGDSAKHHAGRSTTRGTTPQHAVEQARGEERHGEQSQERRLRDDKS